MHKHHFYPASLQSLSVALLCGLLFSACENNFDAPDPTKGEQSTGPDAQGTSASPEPGQPNEESTGDSKPSTTDSTNPSGHHSTSAHPKDAEHPKHTNRLATETSPYLLMHAHNPVDWYPWGSEALEKAKRENKIIFLSVGYSSCYWCHVMERESFLDKEIAAFLNKHFVCIKVDREERPDVDSIYMAAVIIYSGRGGWPMSVFMTPDGKPFFGGSYFPARDGDRPRATGFLTVIGELQKVYKAKPSLVEEAAEKLTKLVREHLQGSRPNVLMKLNDAIFRGVTADMADQYDPVFGGFGYSAANPAMPKFPNSPNLVFLLDRAEREKQKTDQEQGDSDGASKQDAAAGRERKMLEKTLDRMAMGGIRDHLGGGFHRYSVDRFLADPTL